MVSKKNVVSKYGLFPFHCDAKGLNTLLSTTGQKKVSPARYFQIRQYLLCVKWHTTYCRYTGDMSVIEECVIVFIRLTALYRFSDWHFVRIVKVIDIWRDLQPSSSGLKWLIYKWQICVLYFFVTVFWQGRHIREENAVRCVLACCSLDWGACKFNI